MSIGIGYKTSVNVPYLDDCIMYGSYFAEYKIGSWKQTREFKYELYNHNKKEFFIKFIDKTLSNEYWFSITYVDKRRVFYDIGDMIDVVLRLFQMFVSIHKEHIHDGTPI